MMTYEFRLQSENASSRELQGLRNQINILQEQVQANQQVDGQVSPSPRLHPSLSTLVFV